MEYTYDIEMFRETFESDFTYINGFLRNVHRFADKRALYCPLREQGWTYDQLNREANRLAHALLADGVKRNDVIMYQIPIPQSLYLVIGAQKIGAINSPINFPLISW